MATLFESICQCARGIVDLGRSKEFAWPRTAAAYHQDAPVGEQRRAVIGSGLCQVRRGAERSGGRIPQFRAGMKETRATYASSPSSSHVSLSPTAQ